MIAAIRGSFLAGFLAAGLLASGCGSSSSTTNPDGLAEGFMGTWDIQGSTTSFSLSCPASTDIGTVSFPIWTELELDHGVLSDLADVSKACVPPGITFDVDKKGLTASAVNPDPFSGNAPLCEFVLGNDTAGNPVFIDFSFSSLTITKLADSGTGKAPRVLFAGSAMGPLMRFDSSGKLGATDTCTYDGSGDIFQRMTQP
jgi:hypothetical protein